MTDLERRDKFGEEGGDDAGDVNEGPLLPKRHPRPQRRRQPHRLRYQRSKNESVIERSLIFYIIYLLRNNPIIPPPPL